jgi:predicted alpha/beta hydrolase
MVANPSHHDAPRIPLRAVTAPAPDPGPEPGPPFQELTIDSVDGVPLNARFYPAVGTPRGAVLVVGAMAVPQSYYVAFCGWLASRGLHAMTFDFRGMGASRTTKLRAVDTDVITWGRFDATAALRALQDRAPGLPLTWIGHSLGGQILPFVPDHVELAKVITVAAGSGYWKQNAAPLRKRVWLFWWVFAPIATPLFGYFPGKALGMVGDLPKGVLRQWRKWCLDPEYSVGAEGDEVRELYARVKVPITSLSFTDDEMMSEASIASLHGFYTRSDVTLRRFAPNELGAERVGHFGWFRPAMREHWDRILTPEIPLPPGD